VTVLAPAWYPHASQLVAVGRRNASAWRCVDTSPSHCGGRWLRSGALAVAAMITGCATSAAPGFPSPPRVYPVSLPVLVSADGRVITGVGSMACGHDPRLAARSYPSKVTLTWVNPDTNCNAETLRSAVARARLPAPLGNRALVQAASGAPVRYFDERDLARADVLPAGFRLSSDLPSVSFPQQATWAVGDTRTYTGPASTAARLSIAQLAATHGLIPLTPWPWPAHVRVNGRPAALLVDRANSLVYSRSITWVDHGYRFVVNISVQGHKQVPLSNAELTAVADGIRSRLHTTCPTPAPPGSCPPSPPQARRHRIRHPENGKVERCWEVILALAQARAW
jgi:hypothetical protein